MDLSQKLRGKDGIRSLVHLIIGVLSVIIITGFFVIQDKACDPCDVALESGENPEHYQGAVMWSEPQNATDESREGEGSVEAESEYAM